MKKLKTASKKELLLGLVTILLFIIAFVGFTFDKKKIPPKIAFETKGGGIIFDHQSHTALEGVKCKDCHHNYQEDKFQSNSLQMSCRKCHYGSKAPENCKDEAIHKHCIGKNCQKCHVENSVKCSFCHNAEEFVLAEKPKIVEFDTDGGLVKFNHFLHSHEDELGLDCSDCHHGYSLAKSKKFPMNCRRCHYNSKYESKCENEDAHIRCIGKNCVECHSDDKENCEKCHQ